MVMVSRISKMTSLSKRRYEDFKALKSKKLFNVGMSKSTFMFGLGILVGAVLVLGIASVATPATAQDSAKKQSGVSVNTEFVSLTIEDDYSVDVEVRTPNFNVSFTDLNPETGVEGVEADSESMGEEEADASQTGLCAVGLGGEDSPLPFGVKDNGDISSEANPHGVPDTETADDVLEECQK